MSDRKNHVTFAAQWLYVLQPFIEYGQSLPEETTFIHGHLFVEPARQGGALIIAANAHALLLIHDQQASCSGPLTLDVPEDAFQAATPPEPAIFWQEGERLTAEMPEWMQPGRFVAHDHGMWIEPRMRHPQWAEERQDFFPMLQMSTTVPAGYTVQGLDFEITPGIKPQWRRMLTAAFADAGDGATAPLAFDPAIVSQFDRICALTRKQSGEKGAATFHRATRNREGTPGPIIMTFEGHPHIVGTYMPQRADGYVGPSWALLHAAREGGKANG
ncbi:hypothetical protein BJF92_12020 [Rhizobium rhizosphaerae]|uniref:Uncharacterized protein n=1 Tax=Xaviernesmea rhizosphaerae TaxID=1672749 RepID=A0A1Q9AN15_9HYPH|nr:hypothetical protein [Xaviernesmea rhizosphaerae]OLP56792.1 hypothetical protein BJF92_12020 [Xaviernesmea rhizosphaerae]